MKVNENGLIEQKPMGDMDKEMKRDEKSQLPPKPAKAKSKKGDKTFNMR